MKKRNIELNGFLTAMLGLSIAGNVLRYLVSLASLIPSIEYDGYGPLAWSSICTIMIVTSAIGVLLKKRWGVLLMFGWGAIVLVSELISPDSFGNNAFIHDILIYAFWAGLFCLKSNGMSAWKALLFGSQETKPDSVIAEAQCNDAVSNPNINADESFVSPIESLLSDVIETPSKESVKETTTSIFVDKANMEEHSEDSIDKPEECHTNDYKSESIKDDIEEQEQSEVTKVQSIITPEDNKIGNLHSEDNTIQSHRKVNSLFRHTKLIIGLVLLFIILLVTAGLYCYNKYNSPENRFARANDLFSNGKYAKAIEIYTQLADNDCYTPAKTRLGKLYLLNDSIEVDSEKGFKYLKEAAVSDTIALFDLMTIYSGRKCKGKGFRDSEQAKYYAEYALKKNILVADAYFVLGNVYANNNDYESAFFYWQKSAEYGEGGAFDNLGWLTYYGYGCKQNFKKSYRFFSRALEINSNDEYALYHMGLFYLYGYVVDKDKMEAKSYFKRAANLGNENARKEYSRLEMN